MTDQIEETPDTTDEATGIGAWHTLLLRMAGSVPDDLISEARGWLAEGQRADVAQALIFAALTNGVPVGRSDADLMAAELAADGQDTGPLTELEIIDDDAEPPIPWIFSPVRVERASDVDDAPPMLDFTGDPVALAELDPIDRAAVSAVEEGPQVTGLWRVWRAPADDSGWPAPRRIFVVTQALEATGDQAVQLAARMQEALLAAGEEAPQVEVCPDRFPVPAYQGTASAYGALLWALEPAVQIRLARVFDAVDPMTGPSFAPDHPRIEDIDEVERLLDYLDNAVPVLSTGALMADIVDPLRPPHVPLTFRTDGEWIWTDTISYYLEQHQIAPEEGLLAHVRAAGPEPRPVSEVALHRVLAFLQLPDDAEAVWVVPEPASTPGNPVS